MGVFEKTIPIAQLISMKTQIMDRETNLNLDK
jgi:hypothetical protein